MRLRRLLLYTLASIFILLVLGGAFFYILFTKDLPTVEALEEYRPNLITKVYARNGEVIGEFYVERRIVVSLQRMPEHLIQAFLAAEDAKFFEHKGIDYLSIIRAFYKNLSAGKIVQGGSTITQQVAKSFFLTPERRLSRKIREAILAYRIEKRLSKKDILYLYLNQIYFGNGAYGVQAAAETYFGKDVSELSIAESALLAGLPKAPSRYSPYHNPELAKARQEFVLTRMVEERFITRKQAEDALNENIILKPKKLRTLWVGPYFTEHVRRYIEEKYGDTLLYKGGLHIYTTMDVELQKAANEAVSYGLRAYDKRRGYRGPVMTLDSPEDIEAFIREAERRLLKRPIEVGGIYQGVITSLDSKRRVINVAIGNRRGIIRYPDFAWARLYNPTGEPDGGSVVDPLKLFSPGDVIQVKVKYLPEPTPPVEGVEEAEGSGGEVKQEPVVLRLEQEPLAESALLAMEPETGFVRAMVGGSSFAKTQFNRAIQAKRQPGSAFKPIIYAAALDAGYTPATIVVDSPIVFEETTVQHTAAADGVEEEPAKWEWKPRNFEEKFHGPTTVREALTKSRNVVTIKILRDIGVRRAISYARKLGIESPLANDLSLALGSSAVTLLEMTRAYATLGNLGLRPEPVFITKVLDRFGNVLEENAPSAEAVLTPQTAYIMTNLLQGVVENGTGWRARALKRPVAGKTGTTNNLNDAWFIGFVPRLAAGVWVGYDNEQPLGKNETGSRAAAPIWVRFMKKALDGVPPENFPIPDGVEFAKVDPKTGLLANPSTENAVFEVFKVGTTPVKVSPRKNLPHGDKNFFLIDAGEIPPAEEPVGVEDSSPVEEPQPATTLPEAF